MLNFISKSNISIGFRGRRAATFLYLRHQIENFVLLKIAFHNAYIHPLREGHRFPMLKYELIPMQLIHEGLVSGDSFFEPELVSKEIACLAHDKSYVQDLFELTLDARMIRRIGFPLTDSLIQRERLIVDGTIRTALLAMQHGVAFNVAGGTHHAGYAYGEGFCLLNDQAVAAAYLLAEKKSRKILIIDLDVHQGNGTANIFRGNKDVFTFSMHGAKNFPFIKEQSHLDISLEDGITDEDYLSQLGTVLPDLFQKVEPDFVFYQAGVDVLATDKLGKLKLSPEGCKERDYIVLSLCKQFNVPVQISMGGGYSEHIRDIVNAHIQTYRTAIELYNF
ncbi:MULTISPECIES: histone deacetylase [unclassified Sphingobacterium]|uniref:histone deacetylase family protein n=1 Tax=unclassified Sphingobacterium TaxID=2609468 RepID=UPI0025CD1C6D|nr:MULTISPECIES: histone deacetylase [unclassified Sphingobacterium]